MKTANESNPYLKLRVEGPAVSASRMRLADFIKLAKDFSDAAKRVALVLQNSKSTIAGRRREDLLKALSLDIVGFTHGSPAAVALFERSEKQTVIEGVDVDLGEQAYCALVEGMVQLESSSQTLPEGFDTGVLLKVRDIAKTLERGVSQIELTLNHRSKPVRACFGDALLTRIRERIDRPDPQQVTLSGRLLMADFKETAHRLRIHQPAGEPITCVFKDELSDEVEDCIRQFVKITGSAQYNEKGSITCVQVNDIERIEQPVTEYVEETGLAEKETFWAAPSLDQMIAESGILPVSNFDSLLGGWPEDELEDQFEEIYREERRNDR